MKDQKRKWNMGINRIPKGKKNQNKYKYLKLYLKKAF